MNYSENPSMVRVDFFKASGKWYTTEEMQWDRYSVDKDGTNELIHDTFRRCLKHGFDGYYSGMTAVCLEPCHEHGYPLMLINWDNRKRDE